MKKRIILPGGDGQLRFFCEKTELKEKRVLVIGASSAAIAESIAKKTGQVVELIVEDYDSMIISRLDLDNNPNVNVRIMDFEYTDFDKEEIDIVYSQGSTIDSRRNRIVKEIKRILKPGGIYCVGETINLQEEIPKFVEDIYEASDLMVFDSVKSEKYYTERKFEILETTKLSGSLKEYYRITLDMLKNKIEELSDSEKSYHKKLIKKISHESKAYLTQGADKFIGFKVTLLKKEEK